MVAGWTIGVDGFAVGTVCGTVIALVCDYNGIFAIADRFGIVCADCHRLSCESIGY